jgi:hypothetical protein
MFSVKMKERKFPQTTRCLSKLRMQAGNPTSRPGRTSRTSPTATTSRRAPPGEKEFIAYFKHLSWRRK